MKKEEGIREKMQEYRISRNPEYKNNDLKKFLVSTLNGETIGKRNKNGIIALRPGRLHLDVKSFSDSQKELADLIIFLDNKKSPEYVFI